MDARAGNRLVKNLADEMVLNEGICPSFSVYKDLISIRRSSVQIPFNFRLAAQRKRQKYKAPLPLMCWDDDTPRRLWSEDGYVMVATMPKLTGSAGTICHLPPHIGRMLMP